MRPQHKEPSHPRLNRPSAISTSSARRPAAPRSSTTPSRRVALHWALAEIDAEGVQSETPVEAMWTAMSAAERLAYPCVWPKQNGGTCVRPAECPGSLGRWAGYGLIYPDDSRSAMISWNCRTTRPFRVPAGWPRRRSTGLLGARPV